MNTEIKKENNIYDLIILGAGPAGVSAGVYAARKKLNTLVLTKDFFGQSTVSDGIKNWIGEENISGIDLSKKLENHLRSYESDDFIIKDGVTVKSLILDTEKTKLENKNIFEVEIESGEKFYTKTVLVATGSHRRKLTIPGADKFEHKGLTYCASCDGPLYSGKDVVVVGGGNSGFESAAQLLAYTNSVTILNRGEHFPADEMTVKNVLSNPKAKALPNTDIKEIKGNIFADSIIYTDNKTNTDHELKVSGIFVEIGAIPSTSFLPDELKDKWGKVITDPKSQRAKIEGIWAAGDCTDGLYQQNNIASGDAVKALEDLYLYLKA